MKKKPVKYTGLSDEVDCNVPDYKTVIVISSEDQLNITLSKCGLAMLSNLGTVRAVLISTGSSRDAGGLQRSCFFLSPGICRSGQTDGRILPERRGSVLGEEPSGPARLRPPQRDVLPHRAAEHQLHRGSAGRGNPQHGLFDHNRVGPVLRHDLLEWEGLLHTAQ